MVMWPAVTLIGFLVMTALVVLMGMQSTARYERERERAEGTSGARHASPEPVGAAQAA